MSIGYKFIRFLCLQAHNMLLQPIPSSYDITDDVIMTSFNRVRLYLFNINPTKFGEDRMKKGQVIVLTSSRADFTGNDVTDDVIITKINRVLPYPLRNNHVKFHQDRIRFT